MSHLYGYVSIVHMYDYVCTCTIPYTYFFTSMYVRVHILFNNNDT